MDAATLFVEILITGLEAFVWIGLFLSAVFGAQWVVKAIDMFNSAEVFLTTAFLAFAYVVGIIVEELTDAISETWSERLKSSFLNKNSPPFYDMQIYVSTHGGKEDEQFHYLRSRRRILRASAFNIVLIGISALIYLWAQAHDMLISTKAILSVAILIASITTSILSLFAYKRITGDYVKTIQRSYRILKEDASKKK